MEKKSKKLVPFINESDSLGIGGLTVENREDRVSIYGSLDLTRDREGLIIAEALKVLLDDIVGILKADKSLPDKVTIKSADKVSNPFKKPRG